MDLLCILRISDDAALFVRRKKISGEVSNRRIMQKQQRPQQPHFSQPNFKWLFPRSSEYLALRGESEKQ